jgi:hypothetical protein
LGLSILNPACGASTKSMTTPAARRALLRYPMRDHREIRRPDPRHRQIVDEPRVDRQAQRLASADVGERLTERRGRGVGDGDRRRLEGDGRGAERAHEVTTALHLADDVAAPDELAVDEQLRDRRPLRVGLHAVADLGIGEDVHGRVRRQVLVEDANDRRREPALRRGTRALHEQDHAVGLHQLFDALHYVGHGGHVVPPRRRAPRASYCTPVASAGGPIGREMQDGARRRGPRARGRGR